MPSLNALREFQTSFNDIGGEKALMESRNIPFDNLELPDTEPEPLESLSPDTGSSDTPDGFDTDSFDLDSGGDAGESPPVPEPDAPPAEESFGDFDFSAFLNTSPEDIPPPAAGDFDLPDASSAESTETGAADDFDADFSAETPEAAPDSETDGGGFTIPDELLTGFSEEIETAPSDAPGEASGSDGTVPGDDFDLGDETFDLGGDLDLGGEGGAPLEPGAESSDLGGDALDSGGDETGDTFGDLSMPDFEIPGEGVETPDAESPPESSDGDALGDDFSRFNFGGEDTVPESDGSAAVPGTDDFSLPGIDDLFPDPLEGKKPAAVKPSGKKPAGRAKAGAEKTPEESGEINLSEEDLRRFQKTLSGYPLNLRVACEEIIAEQVVAPEQMARLLRFLIRGAPAKETAALAGEILGKPIAIPKGFEKSTGEALEAEQASFAYIFVHNFLPVLALFSFLAIVGAAIFFLAWQFIYIPAKAESIYKIGHERIYAGEYQRANERFSEAFALKRKKNWFYRYAEAFRDERQYIYAEQKYDELLRYYPRDKKAVLDYAALETNYRFNYQKANDLLQHEILFYAPDDPDGLLALGDNNLAWGEEDPSKYEDARFAYARLMEKYGWTAPVVERMMKYFIRTDNLKEVLPLKAWFESDKKRKLSAPSLAELGGYLLDKQFEETRGVPNAYKESITGVRDLLLQAAEADPSLPEAHYHLARYYHGLGNSHDERITLEAAIRAFDSVREESVRRRNYRIDAHQRLADALINSREFIQAEEQLVRGINLYEDAISRRLMTASPEYGRFFAGLGDLEYFTKTGNMENALDYYRRAEQNGWAPPEMQYRMGAACYQLEDWKNALEYFFTASSSLPLNRRLLYALGNTAVKRGDYFAAQGYYNRLLDMLETQRARLPVLLPNDRPEYLELAERLMMARNNAGVACEGLADRTGNRSYRTRAMALYAEADRAWDARSRDPQTMIRSGRTPLPFLNSRNILYPQEGYEPQLFIRIDRDVLEPSMWEQLAPIGTPQIGGTEG